MNKKTTAILFAVFIILAAVLFLKNNFGRLSGAGKPFSGFDISAVTVAKEGRTITDLFSKDGKWYVSSDIWPGEKDTIEKAVGAVKGLILEGVISSRQETYDNLRVSSATAVIVRINPGKKETGTIYIGKRSPDYVKSYVRIGSDPRVYLAQGVYSGLFDRDESYWKDKDIFGAALGSVESIVIKSGEDAFDIVDMSTGPASVLLEKLGRLKATGFSQEPSGTGGQPAELMDIEITRKEGAKDSFKVIEKEGKPYVKKEGTPALYGVNPSLLKDIREYLQARENGFYR
ncbi:MAG: DUF4340 domain-containing protein [Elusimicrobia bacterium]|nr:DUF4340 domain-containing protein [Elusimicrobiota bacterium]